MTNQSNAATTTAPPPADPAGPAPAAPSEPPPRADLRRSWSPPTAQSIELAPEVTAYAGRR
ncbi:hypothetical protein ACFYST_03780 [Kitasatospora sp. NPDC004614]|uniref:hypothetical protein n=1 Tax=unclassified Kitasatospora TaxID=2633591 RepID=UPI0036C2F5D2